MKNRLVITSLCASVFCRSAFYSALDDCDTEKVVLNEGLNILRGEIDSGLWAIGYVLSMFGGDEKIIVNKNPVIQLNGCNMSIEQIQNKAVYLDTAFPLFQNELPVCKNIEMGLSKSKFEFSVWDIKSIFKLTDERFDRQISACGNEKLRAMAAIGFSYGKIIYCYPWMSYRRYLYSQSHIRINEEALLPYHAIEILPIGRL